MQYTYHIVSSEEEKKQARDIVLEEYTRSGYLTESVSQSGVEKILPSDEAVASSHGIVLAISHEGFVVGTVSVILDSSEGLPMDSLYRNEIDELRQSGVRLAEIVQLAIDRKFKSGTPGIQGRLALLLPLFRGILDIGAEKNIDGFCITVNPKHDHFYKELGFVSIGIERYYEALGGAPTLPKVLYWKEVIKRKTGISELLFNEV